MEQRKAQLDEYTVGIITALPHERAAVIGMLDEKHDRPANYTQDKHDHNVYAWGNMGDHNVVVATLPAGSYGTNSAAHTVGPMLSSLPNLRFGLLVGIGAGIPQPGYDVRLGDVAISVPQDATGGIFQYDAFKAKSDHQVEHIGFLNQPSSILLAAVQSLKGNHILEASKVPEYLEAMVEKWPKMAKAKPSFTYQGSAQDRLFPADYQHVDKSSSCSGCDSTQEMHREARNDCDPVFHYGIIASGNTLVKDSLHRDELVKRIPGCICFEMEAAGVMNKLPCLVIRGICDYADSHKNDLWRNYAAAVAAAYAKELLCEIAEDVVNRSKTATEIMNMNMNDVKSSLVKMEPVVTKISEQDEADRLKKWIGYSDTSNAYNRAKELHQEGTGVWFLQSDAFHEWTERRTPLIWIHGIPGSGKTILSSAIIEKLLENQRANDAILYFYFGLEMAASLTLGSMVGAFAFDLSQNGGAPRKILQRLREDCKEKSPPTERLIEVFQSMANCFESVKVVIDALDEVEGRSRLLSWIENTTKSSDGRVQLVVTSRNEQDIGSHLEDLAEIVILSKEVVENDIEAYVEKQVRENPNVSRWHQFPEIQEEIKSTLITKADGM
ncbi:hypothetical protein SLS55_006163 [Diplodia seriata]|uniref:Nephrocystin 3-like N-terminal domain-containing protein n=1 Tax=Diplodia seriata TaxID=420778 RepID=A0ABR3CDR0_9PEZI